MKITLVGIMFLIPFIGYSQGKWTKQTSTVTSHLLDVFTLDKNTAFAVGNQGKILKTADGGKTWGAVNSNATKDLYNVYFTDSLTGFATGSDNVKTTDGGKTWSKMNITNKSQVLIREMFWLDKNTGFLGGTQWSPSKGYLFKTTDGGNTWAEISLPSCQGIYGVTFSDTNNGCLATYGGEILTTNDAGKTWKKNILTSKILSDVVSTSTNKLFASGRNGALFYSADQGVSWNSVYSGTMDLGRVFFVDESLGLITGGSMANNTGLIWTTTDSGKTWTSFDPKTSRLTGLHMYSKYLGYAVGLDGTILKYTDNSSSIEEKNLRKHTVVSLYPNPIVKDKKLFVGIKTSRVIKYLTFRIFDGNGKMVFDQQTSFSPTTQLSVQSLSAGMYYLQTYYQSEILDSKKFILSN